MTARYNTACRNCGGRIARGATIARDGTAWVHEDCVGTSALRGGYGGRGTCEDAPCCGCCGPQGDGDYYGYGAAEALMERGYI